MKGCSQLFLVSLLASTATLLYFAGIINSGTVVQIVGVIQVTKTTEIAKLKYIKNKQKKFYTKICKMTYTVMLGC